MIGQADAPASAAGGVRRRMLDLRGGALDFRAWTHTLAVGEPLPTLTLWLADNLAVPLELEASYEETYHTLRNP